MENPEKPRFAADLASGSVNPDGSSRDWSDEFVAMAYATSDSSDGIDDVAESKPIIRAAVL